MIRLHRILLPALGLGLGLLATSETRADGYTVRDLGTLTGAGQSSYADGINASGQVVGASSYGTSGYYHAVVFNTNGTITDIGTLGGPGSYANGINNAGQVVGQGDLANFQGSNAFLYDAGTSKLTGLGTLPLNGAFSSSNANAINNAGTIVGDSNTSQPGIGHAARFVPGGTNVDLGPATTPANGGLSSVVYAVNSLGVAGGAAFQQGVPARHAALFSNGQVTYIGNLGTAPTNSSIIYGLNDAGQAVGYGQINFSANHAFSYKAGSGLTDLGTLGGNDPRLSSYAYAINTAGTIVGSSQYATGVFGSHAFVEVGGVMIDLNSLVVGKSPFVTLNDAFAINDSGQIVGDGTLADGTQHGFVLTLSAVPEPSTFVLLGLGLGLISLVRRPGRRAR